MEIHYNGYTYFKYRITVTTQPTKKGTSRMIQSIYETHLHVRNLEKAIDFYQIS